MEFDYQFWEPCLPDEIAVRFADFAAPWCIAGGWGLDLFLGELTRDHGDIDIVILRKDQQLLQQVFPNAEIFVVDPPGCLRPWSSQEYLAVPLYNIWIRDRRQGPWKVQVLLQDHTEEQWLFRRDHTIKGALANLVIPSAQGIPILSPEIQLLYKAKAIREKDRHDFELVLPYLSATQRTWLREKIGQVYGEPPMWLNHLLVS